MRFVSARNQRRIEKKLQKKIGKKTGKKMSRVEVSKALNSNLLREFLKAFEDDEIGKASPTSSSVHVPTTDRNEEDQPIAPPADLQSTRRSRGVVPPVVANLDAEVEKALNEVSLSSFYKVGFMDEGNDPNNYSKSLPPAPVEASGESDLGLYDMQNLVTGIDWECENNTNGDEEQAKIYAQDNLADDPNFYKKKIMASNSTDDVLAKDVNENEEASVSDWPLALDLGSGHARQKGHVGIDLYPYDSGTHVHDLSLGIPAKDGSVAKIHMSNTLHELDEADQKALLSEIQRVLMPGGQLHYEGPSDIWECPEWASDGKMGLVDYADADDQVEKEKAGQPLFQQKYERLATPDAATADDAEPRIGIAQYDQLPADALLAMDALGYYWSDATSSGQGNRLHGYPSQGALMTPEEENKPNNVGKDRSDTPELPTEGCVYALPAEYRYPINDLNEAMSALTQCSGRAEEENVRNAVYRKFPTLRGEVMISDGVSSLAKKIMESEALPVFLKSLLDLLSEKKVQKSTRKLLVRKGSKERSLDIRKADTKKQIAYCVVLSPDELDAQDDWMTAEDIENTAHSYMEKSRVIGKDHEQPIDATPVESYIAPQDLEWADGPHGPQTVKKGSWVLGIKIHDASEWQKVESGEYQGVSVGGLGVRD